MTYDFPGMIELIGFDLDDVLRKLSQLFPSLFEAEYFFGYISLLAFKLEGIAYFLMFGLPFFLLLRLIVNMVYLRPSIKEKDQRKLRYRIAAAFRRFLFHHEKPKDSDPILLENGPEKSKQLEFFLLRILPKLQNSDPILPEKNSKKSKQLEFFLLRILPKLQNLKNRVVDFWQFGAGFWRTTLVIIWCINLNVSTILISALASYFYILGTFKLYALFFQLAKLLVDLIVMFSGAPGVFWILVAFRILTYIREYIGRKRLEAREKANREFIDKLPLSSLVTGWMAAGKTALITDIGISYEAMLRDKALVMLYDLDLRFPDFNWRVIEKVVEFGVSFGFIKNLVGVRDYMEEVRLAYNKHLLPEGCFGYDAQVEKAYSDDGLTTYDIFTAICEYAQLYLIYHFDTSLIVSSYAVRGGLERIDNGYFPLWNSDFYNRKVFYRVEAGDYMSHVIDYDMFRRGKRMKKDNPNVGIFEFGCCLMSEKGKERGNALENQHFKKDDIVANPKNDLFDLDLKLRRHAGTVGFYCFCKFLSDEQRPESVGANEREVSQIIRVNGVYKEGSYYPFFTLTATLADGIYAKFKDFYYKYRNVRDDQVLLMYFLKHLVGCFCGYVNRARNIYGYKLLELLLEDDGEGVKVFYGITKKKLYSGRYSTDCLKGVFVDEIRHCNKSLADLRTYEDIVASVDELNDQGSYMVRDVFNH